MSKYIAACASDKTHTYLNQGNGCPLCRIATLEALLRRYRKETPLGNQPHMIAHEVDKVLGGGE